MKRNVGSVDKMIRVVLALGFFSSFFLLQGNLRYIAAIGFIPLITGIISFCPLYTLVGIKTCKTS
ncbi:MAG: YgaP family membrane protein [Bacteriovoracaceae bacterium]